MNVLDGKVLAQKIRTELKEKIARMPKKPGLAVVIVGENPASQIYVRNKIKACEEIGIRSYAYALHTNTTQIEVEKVLDELAQNPDVNGILLQLPLPQHLNADAAALHIPVEKDVDGFSAQNLGLLMQNKAKVVACTPSGVMKLLESANIDLTGKNAVVLGRSETVGKPMATLLLNANATVTVCHSKTKDIKKICQNADVVVSAIGKVNFVTEDMIKEGAVVVDVGINRDENGKLCGDVDYVNVCKKASHITPVPGGVGPMTITMLLYNTYLLANERK